MERKIQNTNLENKDGILEIKSIDNLGQFSGYASVFNIIDSYNDIILPQAFKNSLNNNKEVKMLWQHQQDKPIGYFTTIKEDSIGLYVEGQILLDLQQGLEAYKLIKNRGVNGLSIGYCVKQAEYDSKNNTRIIKEIDLFEISIVTFPANKYSNITYCKSLDEYTSLIHNLDKLNKILQNDIIEL